MVLLLEVWPGFEEQEMLACIDAITATRRRLEADDRGDSGAAGELTVGEAECRCEVAARYA